MTLKNTLKHLKLDGNMLHVKQRALYTADIKYRLAEHLSNAEIIR